MPKIIYDVDLNELQQGLTSETSNQDCFAVFGEVISRCDDRFVTSGHDCLDGTYNIHTRSFEMLGMCVGYNGSVVDV